MAVCNLFSELTSDTGNFLMFSQYVEDLTKNYAQGDTYKVVPSKFIALNIDYTTINIPTTGNLNVDIPNYFQNYYENGCAYGKNNIVSGFTSDHAKNLFWSAMYAGNFLTGNNIQCINNINLQSYNIHSGMGYGEIYCYIPTNKKQERYNITLNNNETSLILSNNSNIIDVNNNKVIVYGVEYEVNEDNKVIIGDNEYEVINNKIIIPLTLEGYNNITVPNSYSTEYKYHNFINYSKVEDTNINSYNINTIIVLYSIYEKQSNNCIYEDIPMGIYFAGKFNGTNISNPITKHVDTDASTGTAYGLRICTRFSATSQGRLINTDISTENNSNELSNICQLMTAMNENLSAMLNISRNAISENQGYKDLLSIIRNNRTNVPYIKNINGTDYWFVNGRLVSSIQPQQPTT